MKKSINFTEGLLCFISLCAMLAMVILYLFPSLVFSDVVLSKVCAISIAIAFCVTDMILPLLRISKVLSAIFGANRMVAVGFIACEIGKFYNHDLLAILISVIGLTLVVYIPRMILKSNKNSSGDNQNTSKIEHPAPKLPVAPANIDDISRVDQFPDDMLIAKREIKTNSKEEGPSLKIIPTRW